MSLRCLALATVTCAFLPIAAPLFTTPALAVAAETEDIVYTDDGREQHGRIVSETDTEIVFELIDRKLGMKATIRLQRERVVKIVRGVEVQGAAPAAPSKAAKPAPTETAKPASSGKGSDEKGSPSQAPDDAVATIYVIKMTGQMGTDISPGIYREIAKDVLAVKPNMLVFMMKCSDVDDLMIPKSNRAELGQLAFDEYRELVNILKDDLRDIPQVMWIEDAVGISSMIAMAWKDIYMKSDARLAGMNVVIDRSGAQKWTDEDIRAKMTAAYLGYANGFLEYGGYQLELGRAMMLPEYKLSASWEGRKVVWHLDSEGQYQVDDDKEEVAGFRAKTAENLGLTKGTVDDLDDLLFLLGFREYRVIDGKGKKLYEDYRTEWRKALADTHKWWEEYNQFLGWAKGAEAVKYLGQAKSRLTQIINALKKYKAVEIRWGIERGAKLLDLVVLEEQLTEQITALRRGGGGRPGGSGRGDGPGGMGR